MGDGEPLQPLVAQLPDRALSTGSPGLAPLMLSLGRLVVTRLLVTTRGRGGRTP